tara:strand:- start:1445 stop:1693 length:249 start_codon:yes stop_codon:yes gene_type:complete
MKIHESLDQLKATVKQANKMIALSEKSIELSMQELMSKANPAQLQAMQAQIAGIKQLVSKAKSGQNVDAEIKIMTKNIKNGS